MAEQTKAKGQEKVGQVVSTKMAKTIVVEVSRRVAHPLYRRIVKKRKKFYAHDETGLAKVAGAKLIRLPLHECDAVGRMIRQ